MASVNKGTVSVDGHVIQFKGKDGKTVSTGISNVSFIKDGSRNLAFYGSRGKSELSDQEFDDVHKQLGLPLPIASVSTDDDDGIDDLTIP